jgi:hypothetical protein
VAPCLVFNGAEAEASVSLQLLSCVVRQALPVAEINAAIFCCLPMHIRPTMLIGYVHPSMWRLFSASNHPHTYFPNKDGLINLYRAKAAYAGPTSCGFGGDGVLSINCSLNGGKLPLINGGTLKQIAAQFQPKLLDYRLKLVVQCEDASNSPKNDGASAGFVHC